MLTINLDTTETLGVAWKVMQLDSLTEIESLLVKDLPVEVKIKIVLEVDRIVHASCDTEEGASKFLLVAPDGHLAAFKVSKTCSMVGVEVPKDDSLDVGDVVASGFYSIDQIVLLLVDNPIADIIIVRRALAQGKVYLQDVVDRTSHLRPVLVLKAY